MADHLNFSVEELQAQADKLNTIADNLQDNKNGLTTSLEGLKTDWDSDAGRTFFSTYDSDWMTKIDDYIALIREVSNALTYASGEYEDLEADFKRINLS